MTLKQNCFRSITSLLEFIFENYFTVMIAIWRRCVASKTLVTWRSRSQHDLAAKSCPPHNLVIWSLILQLFHRNDHLNETTCREQQLSRCLECQGHSMTLQQNHVRPIALLFEVGFHNYFTEMITILRWHVVRIILVLTLKVNVTAWHSQQSHVWPITLLFEVRF